MNLDNRKTIFGWAMYDWANSAFATTVMAALFPIFFRDYWSPTAGQNVITHRLGNANALAGLIVAVMAPVLGSIADRGTSKKKFLLFFAFMGIVMTCGLYTVSQGNWPLAIALYVAAAVGFSGSNIFYDSLITAVASVKKLNTVSALGYSLGYLGGGILFAFDVLMVLKPETFGFSDKAGAVRFSFLTVGIWWAVFTIPLILFVREIPGAKTISGLPMVMAGLRQLRGTFRNIRQNRMVFLFLLAYWFYIDGVDSVIRMGTDYGNALGFNEKDLIVAILIIQFIGFPAAIAYGYLGNRIGARRGIFLAIVIYIVIILSGAFIQNEFHFYLLAVAIGLIQGGIQALSRSYYAKIIPAEKSAEYFGFYNMMGKFAVILGPYLVGWVSPTVAHISGDSNLGTRVSIASLTLLLIIGGILLCFVRPGAGDRGLSNSVLQENEV